MSHLPLPFSRPQALPQLLPQCSLPAGRPDGLIHRNLNSDAVVSLSRLKVPRFQMFGCDGSGATGPGAVGLVHVQSGTGKCRCWKTPVC